MAFEAFACRRISVRYIAPAPLIQWVGEARPWGTTEPVGLEMEGWTQGDDSTILNQMVKYSGVASSRSQEHLDMIFRALADSTRRAIIERLARGDALVSELAEPFDMSLPAVSKHLGVLEKAGLINREKDGRVRRCNLDATGLKQAADWISFYRKFWEGSLDALDIYLQQKKE